MQRTAGSHVRARVGAGPPMGERGRMLADGHTRMIPGSAGSQFLSLGEGGISFGGPSESFKSKAFVVPDICIVGVKPDSLVERLDCLIIPILGTEGVAFVVPG